MLPICGYIRIQFGIQFSPMAFKKLLAVDGLFMEVVFIIIQQRSNSHDPVL
jgi:hypothetical protein